MRTLEMPDGILLASIAFVRPQPSNALLGAAPQTPQMPAEVTV